MHADRRRQVSRAGVGHMTQNPRTSTGAVHRMASVCYVTSRHVTLPLSSKSNKVTSLTVTIANMFPWSTLVQVWGEHLSPENCGRPGRFSTRFAITAATPAAGGLWCANRHSVAVWDVLVQGGLGGHCKEKPRGTMGEGLRACQPSSP